MKQRWLIRIAGILVIGVLAVLAWQRYGVNKKDESLVSGNGRIEAVEIDVATKIAGRVKEILVREDDFVTAGQVVARMDIVALEAELRQAQAQARQAQQAKATAAAVVAQREREKATATAVVAQREQAKAAAAAAVAQREGELALAEKEFSRSQQMALKGLISQQELDTDYTRYKSATAALRAATAQLVEAQSTIIAATSQVAEAQSAIEVAKSQVAEAQSALDAALATIERIEADIEDSVLKSPRDGRVQYRVAQPGEVLGAGGRVLSLIDLTDVYMTFFLPTAAVGRVALGSEVRLVLDAFPQYVIPAQASFIAAEAQFTPKTVETASEREKLMFRIRAHIPPDLLRKHITQVKTGLPGVAYVRLDSTVEWPAHLAVRLPQ
jgi:HlyD family secretion protein